MPARVLPDWPRMMRRPTAAAYLDLTEADFEREVAAGRLPLPVKLGSKDHWSRVTLERHLERLSGEAINDFRANSKLYATG